MIKTFITYLRLTLFLCGQSVLRAMEYRASFISQVFGMFVNNFCWLGLWFLFFKKFPDVNGWRFEDSALLLGFSCVAAGIMIAFFWGAFDLSRTIYRGELDYYLGFPKNVLWHVSISKGRMSGVGDILSGLVMCLFVLDFTFTNVILFIYVTALSALGLYSFTIIAHSLAFFFGNFEGAADELFWSVITFGIYPSSPFTGALKIIICTLIPAFFIYILPIDLLREFSWGGLLMLTAATVVLFLAAVATFYLGLRRYESGNLMQVRV